MLLIILQCFLVLDLLEKWEVPPINDVTRKLDRLERRIREQEDGVNRVK